MIDKLAIIIAPNWRDYASKYLAECLAGIRKQDYAGSFKVFLADNESSEESVDFIHSLDPEVEIIRNKNNDGFCKGNNDALKVALAEGYEYFVLLNMDATVEKDWLSQLVMAANKAENWGAVQSRIMLWSKPDEINSLGNSLHFLGFGFCAGGGKRWADYREEYSTLKKITYFSGVSVLFKKDVLAATGLFDEEFWMYHDDLDLGWRIKLAGYEIYLAPDSVAYHKYEFAKSVKQYYWLERNRLIFVFTTYHFLTLLLILPALAAMECGLFFFSFLNGFWREKIRSYGWFFSVKSWEYLGKRRRLIQNMRKVDDQGLVGYLSGKIEFQEISNPVLDKIVNPCLNAYWWLARKIICW